MTLKETYLEYLKLDECYRLLDSNIIDNADTIDNEMSNLKTQMDAKGIKITVDEFNEYSQQGEKLAKKIFAYLIECFKEESKLIKNID